ncbi:MAG: NTP transferase domain-containing protein [Mycoplasmatales bacterium]|nr:NTP transferase domain-containing protein [Mycoplasmatales bacterium]
MYKVKNAIILAAGRGTRLKHLTNDTPKPLLSPKGKTFIEDIIDKLHEKNIKDIYVVTGYKGEQFEFLKDRVKLIKNENWDKGNNITSLKAAINYLSNSLIINGDVIMQKNVIKNEYEFSLTYAEKNKNIDEWIVEMNNNGQVTYFNKNGLGKEGFYQREIIFVTEELVNEIKKDIDSFDINEYQEYLWIHSAQKCKIPFKIFEVNQKEIFDLDTVEEYNNYKNS